MATVKAADKPGTTGSRDGGSAWGMGREEKLPLLQRMLSYLWIGFTQPSPPAQRDHRFR